MSLDHPQTLHTQLQHTMGHRKHFQTKLLGNRRVMVSSCEHNRVLFDVTRHVFRYKCVFVVYCSLVLVFGGTHDDCTSGVLGLNPRIPRFLMKIHKIMFLQCMITHIFFERIMRNKENQS